MSVSHLEVAPIAAPGVPCDRRTAVTRSLLGYLALAGPLYVVVSLAQALTRAGFDLGHNEWSLLALGHLGWIQMANLAVTGLMVVAGAAGMRRAAGAAGAGRWAPRLVAGYGGALVLAGIFRADPAAGFPAGTPAGPARHVSAHGMLHLVSGSVGFACLIAACLVVAHGLNGCGRGRAAIASRAVGAMFAVAFAGIASGSGGAATNLLFTAAVIVASGWLTAVAVDLYRSAPPAGAQL